MRNNSSGKFIGAARAADKYKAENQLLRSYIKQLCGVEPQTLTTQEILERIGENQPA